MINDTSRKRLYREAFALLERADILLENARARHEQMAAELAAKRKAV